MSKKMVLPADCRPSDIVRLPRDSWSTREAWLLLDGSSITLCKQRTGEGAAASVTISRRSFNTLIRAYLRPVKLTEGR